MDVHPIPASIVDDPVDGTGVDFARRVARHLPNGVTGEVCRLFTRLVLHVRFEAPSDPPLTRSHIRTSSSKHFGFLVVLRRIAAARACHRWYVRCECRLLIPAGFTRR